MSHTSLYGSKIILKGGYELKFNILIHTKSYGKKPDNYACHYYSVYAYDGGNRTCLF